MAKNTQTETEEERKRTNKCSSRTAIDIESGQVRIVFIVCCLHFSGLPPPSTDVRHCTQRLFSACNTREQNVVIFVAYLLYLSFNFESRCRRVCSAIRLNLSSFRVLSTPHTMKNRTWVVAGFVYDSCFCSRLFW